MNHFELMIVAAEKSYAEKKQTTKRKRMSTNVRNVHHKMCDIDLTPPPALPSREYMDLISVLWKSLTSDEKKALLVKALKL